MALLILIDVVAVLLWNLHLAAMRDRDPFGDLGRYVVVIFVHNVVTIVVVLVLSIGLAVLFRLRWKQWWPVVLIAINWILLVAVALLVAEMGPDRAPLMW